MDSFFVPLVLFLLFGGVGWLLGVIGFFRAGSALAEVRELRRELAHRAPVPEAAAVASAPAEPDVLPAPTEPEPAAPPEPVVGVRQSRPSCPRPPRRSAISRR